MVRRRHPPGVVRRRSREERGGATDRVTAVVQELGRSPGLCWLAAGALFVIAATPLAGPPDLTPTTLGAALTKNVLYAGIAGFVILPGIFAPADSRFVRVLSSRVPRHVGHLSYGIFCVHLLLLELIADWRDMPLFGGRGIELFVLTLRASLLVSEVLHRVVERPAQRLRDAWPRQSRSATTSAPERHGHQQLGQHQRPRPAVGRAQRPPPVDESRDHHGHPGGPRHRRSRHPAAGEDRHSCPDDPGGEAPPPADEAQRGHTGDGHHPGATRVPQGAGPRRSRAGRRRSSVPSASRTSRSAPTARAVR